MYGHTTGYRGIAGLALTALLAGCTMSGGAPEPSPPDNNYVPGSGYHLLMAEIAAQRGAQAIAADEYLNAAERSDDAEVSQRAAEFAYEHGFDAYALRAARRWAQLAPEEASAQLVIARLLVRRDDVPAATAAAERALGPPAARTGEDYLMFAGELGGEDNAEAVTRVMTRLAARAPDSASLRLAVATSALSSRDFDLALEQARAALAADAQGELTAEANAVIGRALFAQGNTEAALAHMAARAAADPSLETGLEYAGLLATADRTAEALAALDGLAKQYGNETGIRRLRALVSIEAGDLQTAWQEFSELARGGEDIDESLLYLAELSLNEQRIEQALQLYARIGSGPWLITAQDAISRIAEAQGDERLAIEVWTRVAQRYPRYAFEADRRRVAALQRMGNEREALAVLNEMIMFRPDDSELLLARGALLEQMDEVDAALADMAAVVRLRPDSAVALNSYGYTLANRTRRQDEAYRLIRRAIERQPDSAAIMDSYGWVLFKLGRLPEARSWLQTAWAQFPDPEVAAHLGEVMWQQDERDAARRLWAEALEKDPDSEPLRNTIARFIR